MKFDKLCGRNTSDLSFGEGPILNGDWAKDAAAEMYGEVHHPTIVDIVLMILDAWDKVKLTSPDAKLEDLYFYKVDVSGAVRQIPLVTKLQNPFEFPAAHVRQSVASRG